MGTKEQESEPTAEFLEELGKHLSQQDGVDPELANIVRAHLLRVEPAQDVVVQAKAAIVRLAGERAAPPKAEEADG